MIERSNMILRLIFQASWKKCIKPLLELSNGGWSNAILFQENLCFKYWAPICSHDNLVKF